MFHKLIDILEQIKSPKGQLKGSPIRPTSKEAGKEVKKETKDDKKKPIASKKEIEEAKKEEITIIPEPVKKEEKEPEISFNYYEKQLNPIKEEHLTSGALLEAIVDEINHNNPNSQHKAEVVQNDLRDVFQNFDSSVLNAVNNMVIIL